MMNSDVACLNASLRDSPSLTYSTVQLFRCTSNAAISGRQFSCSFPVGEVKAP